VVTRAVAILLSGIVILNVLTSCGYSVPVDPTVPNKQISSDSAITSAKAPTQSTDVIAEDDEQSAGSSAEDVLTFADSSSPSNNMNAPIVTFSISEANHTTPEDILQEVSYSYGGAGGGSICDGERASEGAFLIDNPAVDVPIELGHQILIGICGWRSEDVEVPVALPNGDLRLAKAKYWGDTGDNISQSLLIFYPDINDPVGVYTFSFSGHTASPTLSVDVIAPTGPRLLLNSPQHEITLYNFMPNEMLRLFAYEADNSGSLTDTHALAGWGEYQVDPKGQLTINVEDSMTAISTAYAAIGVTSGQAKGFAVADEQKLIFVPHLPADIAATSVQNVVPQLCKRIVYSDDFSDIHSGWEVQWVNPFNGSANGYRDDAYFFQVEVADAPMWYVLDRKFELGTSTVRVSANKRQGEGLFGLILGIEGDYSDLSRSKYLLATLSTSGAFSIEEHIASNSMILAEGQIDPNIADDSYKLGLKRNGTELSFFVDDTEITQAQTDSILSGEVGLYVQATSGGTPLEVKFDDFEVCS